MDLNHFDELQTPLINKNDNEINKKRARRKMQRKILYDWKDPAEVSRLISLVEKRPVLWDVSSPEYKLSKGDAWKEIATEFGNGIDWNEAKVKWMNLRVTFRTNIAKLSSKSSQGTNEMVKIPWRHFEEMMFVEVAKVEQMCESTSSLPLPNATFDETTIKEEFSITSPCVVVRRRGARMDSTPSSSPTTSGSRNFEDLEEQEILNHSELQNSDNQTLFKNYKSNESLEAAKVTQTCESTSSFTLPVTTFDLTIKEEPPISPPWIEDQHQKRARLRSNPTPTPSNSPTVNCSGNFEELEEQVFPVCQAHQKADKHTMFGDYIASESRCLPDAESDELRDRICRTLFDFKSEIRRAKAQAAVAKVNITVQNGENERKKTERLDLRETEGYCAKLVQELRDEEPELYRNFVRISEEQFNYLFNSITPLVQKPEKISGIPALDRLVVTLRYLATGENFSSLQYLFRIPQTTISKFIPDVLDAIYKVLSEEFVKVPKTKEDWEAVAREFYDRWQFPNCIGALDGKHVVIASPLHSSGVVYNYKGSHSIILLAIANPEHKLIYFDVGRSGNLWDGGVFNRCTFGEAMNTNLLCLPPPKALPGREIRVPYVLVADDAFAIRPNLMKPYAQRGLTMVQRVFNYRLSRPLGIIENVFGIMSARFGVLRKPIHLDSVKAKKVVLACCVLHNFLISTNKDKYAPDTSFDQYDGNGNITTTADWRAEEHATLMFPLEAVRDRSNDAKEVQKEFAAYFVDEGDIEWQYTHL